MSQPQPSEAILADAHQSMNAAIAMLGNAFLDLSHRRREVMRSGINRRYQGLCHSSVPVTKFLYGDNVQESIKEINEMSKLAKTVSPNSAGRYHPYNRDGGKGSSRPFQKSGHLNKRGPPAPSKGHYSNQGHHNAGNQKRQFKESFKRQ